ncbi:hypothetical protein DEU32_107122 [Curtobacterium sp. AG1037]|uniref:hypothetical protein n=1 Tax=Curtobacterium sp. AG1037 TaxID=2183990 RepID=UPI000E0C6F9C|nr:hypothetical protein [Curtobacterium sp. AG1037]RDH97434.1 hypothetical protein DEU32_107122 [Curtobacterium sp. AG1037]
MTLRTLLALGAAVLAVTAGPLGVGPSALGGAPTAAAAELPGDGAPSTTPSVDVSTAKLRRVDAVELDAESLVFRSGDKTVADVSMRDSRSTVDLLNRLLGTPARTQTAIGSGGACFPSGTTYTWGGALRVAALTTPAEAGNAVEIRVLKDAVRSRSGDPVALSGPDGVQVGDDIGDELRAAPRSDKVSFGSGDSRAWQLLLEPGWAPTTDDDADTDTGDETAADDDPAASGDADDAGSNGVSALTNGTVVSVLGSPMPVHAQRSC